jgi:hypothetical protein
MTIQLPNEILNRVMRFNSHATADIIRPYINKIKENSFFTVAFENIIRLLLINNNQICTENKFDIYVLGKILTHRYKVKYISDMPLHDGIFNHVHKDQLMILYDVDMILQTAIGVYTI